MQQLPDFFSCLSFSSSSAQRANGGSSFAGRNRSCCGKANLSRSRRVDHCELNQKELSQAPAVSTAKPTKEIKKALKSSCRPRTMPSRLSKVGMKYRCNLWPRASETYKKSILLSATATFDARPQFGRVAHPACTKNAERSY